jgi:hypothetical protein
MLIVVSVPKRLLLPAFDVHLLPAVGSCKLSTRHAVCAVVQVSVVCVFIVSVCIMGGFCWRCDVLQLLQLLLFLPWAATTLTVPLDCVYLPWQFLANLAL